MEIMWAMSICGCPYADMIIRTDSIEDIEAVMMLCDVRSSPMNVGHYGWMGKVHVFESSIV